jgi:TetR/AcrR family transcriptional regulator of autoinduction and epiphytic fitness
VQYCGRFAQLLRWSSVGMMLRPAIAEAERLPDLAAGLYDVVFGGTARDLASHMEATSGLAGDQAETVANELIGLAAYPLLPRILLGVDPLTDEAPDPSRLAAEVDLDRFRQYLRRVMPQPPS